MDFGAAGVIFHPVLPLVETAHKQGTVLVTILQQMEEKNAMGVTLTPYLAILANVQVRYCFDISLPSHRLKSIRFYHIDSTYRLRINVGKITR